MTKKEFKESYEALTRLIDEADTASVMTIYYVERNKLSDQYYSQLNVNKNTRPKEGEIKP